MAKMNEQARKNLVTLIDSGQYRKTPDQNDKESSIAIKMLVFFLAIAVIASFVCFDYKEASFEDYLRIGAFTIFAVVFVVIMILVSRGRKAMTLGEITEDQRWLILNGEEIEAHLDSIDGVGEYYSLSCSAEYQGKQLKFSSPTVKVRPMAFEKRKVSVFINPEDPTKYLVDIYSHLPGKGNNSLVDRSELKRQPKRTDKENLSLAIIILVGAAAVALAVMIIKYIITLFSQGNNEMGWMMILLLVIVAFVFVYGVVSQFKSSKTVWGKGYYLPAKGIRFWMTTDSEEAIKQFHFMARYIEPSSKRAHEFETIGSSDMEKLVNARVKVFVNPDDLGEYFIDIKGSLEDMGFTAKRDYGEENDEK